MPKPHANRRTFRRQTLQASLRDSALLLREFRAPLIIFGAAVLGIGYFYFQTAQQVGEPVGSLTESFYLMLMLAFLQSGGDFPQHPLLQVWYFIMPLIGLLTLAQGLADFGVLFFNRRARSKEWEMAVASTFERHTVLVGLGHLGYRVVQHLHAMEEKVVVVELNPSADLIAAVQGMGIPVIADDARRTGVLEAAGIAKAKTIILCPQNDALNLQIALKARTLNPNVHVVIRIFDDDFAEALNAQFGFRALSGTSMAAPVFAAASTGADVTHPIAIEGQQFSLARLTISTRATFAGKSVSEFEEFYQVSVVLLRRGDQSHQHPVGGTQIIAGDILAVLGGPEQLNRLVHDND